MEPAVERREHPRVQLVSQDRDRAAMEPAVEQREHSTSVRRRAIGIGSPQWSPPSNGGSTDDAAGRAAAARAAAMEPAVERREHQPVRSGHVRRHRLAAMEPAVERREHHADRTSVVASGTAAMEPAVERREHPVDRRLGSCCTVKPQWSPPSNGGSTGDGAVVRD